MNFPVIQLYQRFYIESNFREVQNVGVKVFFLICKFAIIALAYFITFWKWLEITVAIPYFLQIIGSLLIFESSYFYKQDQENMTSPFPYS
ncbi:unnamed protein product [Paramecium pentaurelia]|uniref:Uncharacterized protein n=1 Tax=Paramecium pentaurelia TaxID=43138 RepID=A0A8S1YIU1_9CILI|nr:unnamed protein product [Paramecium pentaurelia]